jgi:hypothetical protein
MPAGFPDRSDFRGLLSRRDEMNPLGSGVKRIVPRAVLGPLALLYFCAVASANQIPFGYLSYDVTVPGTTAKFDITNQTGPNSTPFPDPTWPVATPVSLTITSLTVDFNNGSSTVFGPSYFTLGADGLSFFGSSLDVSGSNPQPTEAILVGTFDASTITLNDGTFWTISPLSFANSTGSGNPEIVDPSGPCSTGVTPGCLQDGDLAVIYAKAQQTVPAPPLGSGLSGLALALFLLTRWAKLRCGSRARDIAGGGRNSIVHDV